MVILEFIIYMLVNFAFFAIGYNIGKNGKNKYD